MKSPGSLSLRWKFLAATSMSLVVLFLVTGVVIENRSTHIASNGLEQEAQASLHAYESLWHARADVLASVSLALSGMSDVRAAFGTRDAATIRDTAGERWAPLAGENAVFAVTDPLGRVLASFGDRPLPSPQGDIPAVRSAMKQFPRQATGFLAQGGELYQVVVTPVYVDSTSGPALLNVLVAGYFVDAPLALRLREATGGSEFAFGALDRVVASSLEPRTINQLGASMFGGAGFDRPGGITGLHAGDTDYLSLRRSLLDMDGKPAGYVWILRSFEASESAVAVLRRDLLLVWAGALLAALVLAWILAQRLLRPIAALDLAAEQVSRQNYSYRLPVTTRDELGRLANAFNRMCESLQKAERDLIRQERLSTVSRLSSSLVHDLRNPLAVIYASAEMLSDADYSPAHVKRLGTNIFRSAAQVKFMLEDLVDASRGRPGKTENCPLAQIVLSAWEYVGTRAEKADVNVQIAVPEECTVAVERHRIERVFMNLFSNAIEAMDGGGTVTVTASPASKGVRVEVQDTGPGIDPRVLPDLFEPLNLGSKKGGMGLGLALSRQTVLDNGGDMGVDPAVTAGARFWLTLPAGSTHASTTER
jgi:signal transduction histidine kinase